MSRGGAITPAQIQTMVNDQLVVFQKTPQSLGLKWNNKVYTQKALKEHFAASPALRKPGLWGAIEAKLARARTGLAARAARGKATTAAPMENNEESGESKGPRNWLRRSAVRRAKKGKGPVLSAPLVRIHKGDPVSASMFATQGLFNPAVIQAFSGSILETIAFEAGVKAASKMKGVPINTYRYNRSYINHPGELFKHDKRTFIFKPRFKLATLKDAATRNADMGMHTLLEACKANAAAKGEDHVETDIIEVIPQKRSNGKISYKVRLYECKIGEGKSESFPGEAFQLLKGKRMTEMFHNQWALEHPNEVALNGLTVECYFLGWQFSLNNEAGWAPTVFKKQAEKFSAIYQALELQHGAEWTKITTLNPGDLATKLVPPEPAPDWGVIQTVLEADRQRLMQQIAARHITAIKRGTFFTGASGVLKRAREALKSRFVSGSVKGLVVPRGNIEQRHEGAWANYMRNSNGSNASDRKLLSQKWTQACAYLIKKRIVAAFKPGNNAGNAGNASVPNSVAVASESFSLTNARNYDSDEDLAEIIRRFLQVPVGTTNLPRKFSVSEIKFFSTYKLMPVPGKLSRRPEVFNIIRRKEPNLSPQTQLFLGILEGRVAANAIRGALSQAQQRQLNAMVAEGPIAFENEATGAYGLAGIMEDE
jgi:hypothetical protein